MLRALALVSIVILLSSSFLASAPAASPPAPASFLVGFGERDITIAASVNLGGFGFGCCRPSQGVEYPVHARAMVVGDGAGHHVALVSVEVQGSFAAYKNGAFGQYDVAKRVEAATSGALPRDHIILSSDHSHRGADTTGVWGGLTDANMQMIADQTAGAILDAFTRETPSSLRVAEIDARSYVSSDFNQPNQDKPDGWFRMLYAENATSGALRGMYGTFSAHATLHGSPAFLSPDWPGIVSDKITAVKGVPVVLGEGAVGRTHPAGDRSTWEDRIADDIMSAYATSAYITASGVDGHESAITLVGYNAILLAGTAPTAGAGCPVTQLNSLPVNPACIPIGRSNLPPWQTGNTLKTLVSAVRIGDVLLWGAPGEIYPNAQWMVQARVSAPHVFILGLANDQLGYLISPAEDWYKIASTPTSDNTLFNVDIAGGDHVACAAIDLAASLGFPTTQEPRCALWAAEDRTLPP